MKEVSWVRRWFIPDIAFLLTTIILLYCLTSFNGMQMLFRDSDTGWHIRNGEVVLATAQVPHTEPYSFSKPGGAWFAWEWLADCSMAIAHQWDGLRGVYFLYLAVLGAVTWLWFQLMWTLGVWFIPTCLATWIMLTACNIHWLARPHLYGWVFLLLAALAAERGPEKLKWTHLSGVFLLGVLWANIHGSFFLGAAILYLYAGEAFLRLQARWKTLAAWATAATLGSFVNPYGWHVHEHIVRYLSDKELLSHVGEFQSFNFFVDGAEAITLGMVMVGAGIALNCMQGHWARGILCTVLFAGALRSARGIPLMALVGLPLALSAICQAIAEARDLPERIAKLRDSMLQYNTNLRNFDRNFKGYALMPVVLVLLVLAGRSALFPQGAGFPVDVFPEKLAAQIAALPADARIFTSDRFGGWILYRYAGQRKVFFDGRSDYYGAKFSKDYLLLPEARPGWEPYWKQWNFTHALVPKDNALNEVLPLKGWRQIGKDDTALLYEKPSNSITH
ncbi:hypothetical protein [Bryobacter aggregatus]|uniref:hypothetical protein n=1 Tax=Bryobacter aggregatus TaxID=360054 RepID=UPI0004E20032|nr:hypothetical protein [Bryobacter aggregatus]